MPTPFLSIFTRSCCRPELLEENIRSVMAQSDHDLEQIFIVDRKQRGLGWANACFHQYRDRVEGEYVYMLDDDNYLLDRDFVAKVKDKARQWDNPDVILVRVRRSFDGGRLQPPLSVWNLDWERGQRPKFWCGNGRCVVVRANWWKKYVHAYSGGPKREFKTGGDWHFITTLIDKGAGFVRLRTVASDAQQRGYGSKFTCKSETDYFRSIARKYDIGPGQKLRLYLGLYGEGEDEATV